MLASAVHVIVRTIAAGRHYSAAVEPPFVPGLDGVVRLPDGRRVYVGGVQAPYGMLAERAAVPGAPGSRCPRACPTRPPPRSSTRPRRAGSR